MPLPQTITLQADNLTKSFDRKIILQNISFRLNGGESLAITGKNGSGKSTLIKILSNTLSLTSGEMNLQINDSKIKKVDYYKYTGVVSPYLNFYDEFTAYELIELTSRVRGIGKDRIEESLDKVGLYNRRNDLIRIFSSGMKQRLKFAFVLLHQPGILLLDEPMSNLDEEGVSNAERIIKEYGEKGIIIIATNSAHEKSLCTREVNLDV
jgi:heme exporter protein A